MSVLDYFLLSKIFSYPFIDVEILAADQPDQNVYIFLLKKSLHNTFWTNRGIILDELWAVNRTIFSY